MDRKKYLDMCKECSMLPKGALGIPTQIPEHLRLYVNGKPFYPVAYKLYWADGQIQHRAELHDIGVNCILSVNLLQLEDNNK